MTKSLGKRAFASYECPLNGQGLFDLSLLYPKTPISYTPGGRLIHPLPIPPRQRNMSGVKCGRNDWLGAGVVLLCLFILWPIAGRGMGRVGIRTVELDGVEYWTAIDAAAEVGLVSVDRGKTLTHTLHRFAFAHATRRAEYNGGLVWLHRATMFHRGQMMVSKMDWQSTIEPLVVPGNHLSRVPSRIIVLDPGHGGHDKGASNSTGLVEKKLALEFAMAVRGLLQTRVDTVYLTRETDVFVALSDRPRIAEGRRVDVMVRIHCNQAGNIKASGVEVFVLTVRGQRSTSDTGAKAADTTFYPGNRNDGANMILGQCLKQRLVTNLGARDRGVRRARFLVLREAPCPAALVECGFLSHPGDARKMASPSYRRSIAESLTQGILDMYSLWEHGEESGEGLFNPGETVPPPTGTTLDREPPPQRG